jgi:hypothetical protein
MKIGKTEILETKMLYTTLLISMLGLQLDLALLRLRRLMGSGAFD